MAFQICMKAIAVLEKKEEVDWMELDFVEESSDDVLWALEIGLGERLGDKFLVS